MSAIAALWYRNGRCDAGAGMEGMLSALAAYGPDRAGRWHDGEIALGSRLMALLPEDRFDRQPVAGNALTLVATARLDNRAQLATLLDLEPACARQMADSQFVMAAYLRWGEDCLDRLLGDFSFAVWDTGRRRLFCARDHLGRHPLVYFASDRLFALASLPRGLFAVPEVPRRLNENEVIRRLRCGPFYEQAPRQSHIYAGLRNLPAGHCLIVTEQGETLRRYWTPDSARLNLRDDDAYVDAFREVFAEAVRCRLRAAGEVGSQLSGGLDSSAVTVTAARLLAAENRGMVAFTAAPRIGYAPEGAADWPIDESHAAGLIAARHDNLTHVIVRPDGPTPLDAIRRGLQLADRAPLNPCNAVWEQQIYTEAERRGVKVLLTGQTGNITISYDGYPRLAALLRQGRWVALGRELLALPLPFGARLSLTLQPLIPAAVWEGLRRLVRPARARHTALHPDLAARFERRERAEERAQTRLQRDSLAARAASLFRVDLGAHLAGMAAGWGIDTRDPTADRRVIEFTLALPDEQYLRFGVSRRLLRRAFADVLPSQILDPERINKGQQAADFHERLGPIRDELMTELDRMEKSAFARHCLDLPRLRRLVDRAAESWRPLGANPGDRVALMRGLATGGFILEVESGNV